MNEESTTSSSSATATAFSKEQEVSPLKALQDILRNRISQKKGQVHESNSKAYRDSLSER
jgi:hypothetical protein